MTPARKPVTLDDLHPHAPARVAMILYNQQYAAQNLGSMGFWASLTEGDQRLCTRLAEEIKAAPMPTLATLREMRKEAK